MNENNLIDILKTKIESFLEIKDILIIGVDGPTASGKTFLANRLANALLQNKINVDFYRLDWQLKERKLRISDLRIIKKSNSIFNLEGEMHMDINEFYQFLSSIKSLYFNNSLSDKNEYIFSINNLYQREKGGLKNGEYKYALKKKQIIICEGHYTSRTELAGLIDYNVCLLGNKEEFLKRKVKRVSGYRGEKEAIDYFERIDIPSFAFHIQRNFRNIDLIINNTNYKNPILKERNYLYKWVNDNYIKNNNYKNNFLLNKRDCNLQDIFQIIFSVSELDKPIDYKIFLLLTSYSDNIISIVQNRFNTLNENKIYNLTKNLENSLTILEKQIKIINCDISVNITTKQNLYISQRNRRLPITLGIELNNLKLKNESSNIRIIYCIYSQKLEILFSWSGGNYLIKKEIELLGKNNELINCKFHLSSKKEYKSPFAFEEFKNHNLTIFTPTDFCIPEFVKNYKKNIIYTNKENETTSFFSIFNKFISSKNGLLINRFSEYRELYFYKNILISKGFISVNIFNYLISLNTEDYVLFSDFRLWIEPWLISDEIKRISEKNYDTQLNNELKEAKEIIFKKSKIFNLIDNFLVKKIEPNSILEKEVCNELETLLLSNNRTVRKKTFQYILEDNPYLSIDSKDFLLAHKINYEYHDSKNIKVCDIGSFYPTILSEIYLWQNLRGEDSAILGANIYDISGESSLDASGILKSASLAKTAVVIQSSLNAIGQKEYENNEKYYGYLNIDNGPLNLVNYSLKSIISNNILEDLDNPLYGLGLDHIDFKNDKPDGRANRFISKALETKNITHFVLDGSTKFNANNRSISSMRKAYEEIIDFELSLIENNISTFLIDKEFCIGELNYLGNSSKAIIPTEDEVFLFTKILNKKLFTKNLGFENCRPSLFIGNIGTTHHGNDDIYIDTDVAYRWVNKVKSLGLVSAVLHGTTSTSLDVLKRSTSGCHKVNIAGEFLKVYQNSLPNYVRNELKEFNKQSKYLFPEISKIKDSFTKSETKNIVDSIASKSAEIISYINSPELTIRDKLFFHRFSYSVPPKLINLILNKYKKNLSLKFSKNSFESKILPKAYFSVSMIEVSFMGGFCEYSDALILAGIKQFHIDIGDGIFISRSLSALEKVRYLNSLDKSLELHAHFMVKEPHKIEKKGESFLNQYINAGICNIALHQRSFKSKIEFVETVKYLQEKGLKVGLVIEVQNNDLESIWEFILKNNINWVVIMGVPIGYGGQLFNPQILDKIFYLRNQAISTNYELDIEVDGGLTMENIFECRCKGANLFAGWSIIKSKSIEDITTKYKKVCSLIK